MMLENSRAWRVEPLDKIVLRFISALPPELIKEVLAEFGVVFPRRHGNPEVFNG